MPRGCGEIPEPPLPRHQALGLWRSLRPRPCSWALASLPREPLATSDVPPPGSRRPCPLPAVGLSAGAHLGAGSGGQSGSRRRWALGPNPARVPGRGRAISREQPQGLRGQGHRQAAHCTAISSPIKSGRRGLCWGSVEAVYAEARAQGVHTSTRPRTQVRGLTLPFPALPVARPGGWVHRPGCPGACPPLGPRGPSPGAAGGTDTEAGFGRRAPRNHAAPAGAFLATGSGPAPATAPAGKARLGQQPPQPGTKQPAGRRKVGSAPTDGATSFVPGQGGSWPVRPAVRPDHPAETGPGRGEHRPTGRRRRSGLPQTSHTEAGGAEGEQVLFCPKKVTRRLRARPPAASC